MNYILRALYTCMRGMAKGRCIVRIAHCGRWGIHHAACIRFPDFGASYYAWIAHEAYHWGAPLHVHVYLEKQRARGRVWLVSKTHI